MLIKFTEKCSERYTCSDFSLPNFVPQRVRPNQNVYMNSEHKFVVVWSNPSKSDQYAMHVAIFGGPILSRNGYAQISVYFVHSEHKFVAFWSNLSTSFWNNYCRDCDFGWKWGPGNVFRFWAYHTCSSCHSTYNMSGCLLAPTFRHTI
jgi:hypothetical protein